MLWKTPWKGLLDLH